MRPSPLLRLLDPVGLALARQLSGPRGWFGRAVMTRVLNRGNRDLIAATLEALSPSPEARLLDVGFGGGALLELAGRRGVVARWGADPSADAVAWLRARRGWRDRAERLQQGAVEALPFADGQFDAVASTNTVYFWPDLARAFTELHRVLAPGGRLALGFSGAAKLRGFDAITRHGFHLHEDEAVRAAARAAGFVEVAVAELHGPVTEGDRVLLAARAG